MQSPGLETARGGDFTGKHSEGAGGTKDWSYRYSAYRPWACSSLFGQARGDFAVQTHLSSAPIRPAASRAGGAGGRRGSPAGGHAPPASRGWRAASSVHADREHNGPFVGTLAQKIVLQFAGSERGSLTLPLLHRGSPGGKAERHQLLPVLLHKGTGAGSTRQERARPSAKGPRPRGAGCAPKATESP